MWRVSDSRLRDTGSPIAESVGVGSNSVRSPSCFRSTGRMGDRADGLQAHWARECPSASCAQTRSPCTTIQEHEGSSRQGRLSATIYGSHRSLTRTDIAWTLRVLRTFPRTRSILIPNDGWGTLCLPIWLCFTPAQPNQRLQPSAADEIMSRRG